MINEIIKNNGGYLKIKVNPSSHKNEISEIMSDGTIKIRITAAPEKGKANNELIKFIAKELSIPKTRVQIISGHTDQLKLIRINES